MTYDESFNIFGQRFQIGYMCGNLVTEEFGTKWINFRSLSVEINLS